MRRSIFTAFALCLVLLSATGFSRRDVGLTGGISARHGLNSDLLAGGSARIDTFRLLVRDADLPNADAVTNGWVLADSFYTQINDSTANEAFMRYGAIDLTNASAPLYFATGGYSRRFSTSSEYDQTHPQYWAFFAFNVSGLEPGHRVEDAYLVINLLASTGQAYDGSGYLAARLDTVVADYAMLNSVSARTDAAYMELSSTKSDLTNGTDWTVTPANRDDLNDYGPSGARWYPSGNLSAGETIRLDVSDPIQQALDYDLLSDTDGWLIFCISGVNNTVNNLGWMFGDDVSVDANPCLTVTTSSKRGSKHWGSGKLPVVLDFDDNHIDGNEQYDYYTVMTDSGLTFTSVAYGTGMADASWDTFNTNHVDEIEYVAHSYDHSYLGTPYVDYSVQLPRTVFSDALTTLPDTAAIVDFAWTGGAVADSQYNAAGMDAIVGYRYRSARASMTAWDAEAGQTTRLSWEHPVNLFKYRADYGWSGTNSDSNSTAEITDYIKDAIDLNYTRYGKAALMLFTHDYAGNGITVTNLRHLIGLVNSMNCVEWKTHGEVIAMRNWNTTVPTTIVNNPEVLVGSPDSAAIYATAAMFDSTRVVDDLDGLASVFSLGRGYFANGSIVPPDYPRGLYARDETIDGELVVLLDWTPNTEGDLFGYRVYRGTSSGGPYSTFVQWVFGEAVATDNTASSGSTYYYVVTAVDDEGNESAYSAEFEITPVISSSQPVYFPVVLRGEDVRAIDASSDSLVVTAEVNLNKAASVKMLSWWKGGGDSSWHNTTPTDTTAARFPWQHYTEAMSAQTRGEFVTDWATAIPIPQWSDGTAADQEDSALTLKWNWQNGNTFPDGAILQRQHNYGAWETVMDNIGFGALGDSIFVHYGASGDTLVGVRKGVENYRVKGWTGTSYANRTGEDETWDMLDSPYYNQAVEYFVQAHAQDGSDWAVGAVLSGIYTTPDWSSVDETAPIISFSSVTYDTTGNVVIEVQTTTDEPAIAGFQIAEDYNRSWRPAIGSVLWGSDGTGANVDSTYASTQNDTIATLISTANLDSLYIRAYARDDSANVSDPVEYVTLFTRASVAVDDTIGTGVVGATASSADLVAYGGRITMDAGGGDITSATAYIGNLTNASLSLKAGLYDTSFNLVASGELTESSAYSGWKTVTFTTPYTATGSTDYIVMFFSGTGGAKMFYDTEGAAGTNIGYAEAGIGYSSFPADPMSPEGSYDTRRYSFYVTFE